MRSQLKGNLIERFSRQIVLKNIGVIGQKKILSSKVLIVGAGGLGSPVVEFLSRAGVGSLGIIDDDKVNDQPIDIGKGIITLEGSDVAILNLGTRMQACKEAIKLLNNNKYKVYGIDMVLII